MGREGGRRCQVDGCSRQGTHALGIGSHFDDLVSMGEGRIEVEEIIVCRVDGLKLGAERLGGWIDVDLDRAAGWRIVLELRPSGGRQVVVLYRPDSVQE